jgi:formate hydrogenlyase transcriptional activator
MEREHIIAVLEETFWRISGPNGAALRLKINPSTLRSRMKKLGIKVTLKARMSQRGSIPSS